MPSIVFVVPELLPVPPTEGGAVEHWVHELSQRLSHRGFEVTVISRPAPAGAGEPAPPADVRYLGVPWTAPGRWWLRLKQSLPAGHPLRALAKLANVLGYAWGVRRALRQAPAELLYVHNDPLLAWLLPRPAGQQRVLHMHNDHLSAPALRPWLPLLMRHVDLVLCVSDHVRHQARRACPALEARLKTLHNATDTAFFRPYPATEPREPAPARTRPRGPGTCQFLYAGRLTPDKGVHVLIAAFAQVRAQHPGARLLIAGSSFFAHAPTSDYQRALVQQARPLARSLAFTGFVPHAQLRYLYADADVVVVPSTWQEPFGLVALEAMSSQTCVIASSVGGLPEVIEHGRTGLLVPPGEVAALAAAMCQALREPLLRQQLAQAARQEVVQHFSYARLAEALSDTLGALVRTRGAVERTQWRRHPVG